MPHLSASSIDTAGDCPKRLQYKFTDGLFVPRKNNVASLRGSAYHKGLELYYLERMERGFFEPTDEDLDRYHVAASEEFDLLLGEIEIMWWDDTRVIAHVARDEEGKVVPNARSVDEADHDHEEDQCELVYEQLAHMTTVYFRGTGDQPSAVWPAEYRVIGVEHEFLSPFIPGWDKKGFIDLLLVHEPTGWLVVDDHKSSGKKWDRNKHRPRKNIQGPMYVMAVKELYGDLPVEVWYSIMTPKGVFERRKSEWTNGHLQAVVDRGMETAGLLATGVPLPANPKSNLCSPKFCQYFEICPSGQKLD
ncbi:MAG: PD-(D/E)XK nuclease family protein [Actinomycetota bacterium]